jgi:hypothetical protein
MPINSCSDNGKPGYKWGDAGKCYIYNPDSEESKKTARKKALAQGIAIGDIDITRANEITTTSMGSGIKKPQQGYPKRKKKIKKVAEDLTQDEAMLAMALAAIAQKYGKFNEDGTGIWAGYESPEENDEKEIGVKCANCVLYEGNNVCKIIEQTVNPEGKCRFAVIPDGVVDMDGDDSDMEDETKYDFLNEFLLEQEVESYEKFLDSFDLADLVLISMIDSEEEENDEEDGEEEEEDEEMSEHPNLSPMQSAQYEGYEDIVEKYGKFDQSAGRNGAHYASAEKNPFKNEGLICANCVFYEGGQGCEIVSGQIEPNAICKLWIIPENLIGEAGSEVEKVTYGRPGPNDPRKTPAKPSERRRGSTRNKPGSAQSGGSVTFGGSVTASLKAKMEQHNKKHGDSAGKKATMGALKAVYRRGAGAFSTSHRPGMTRGGWAMARVNAYLYLLRNGRPSNPNYTTDNDLLPKAHPRSTK